METDKGSEVEDFTTDPTDNDKLVGYKDSTGIRMFSFARIWNWIKGKTLSAMDTTKNDPINSTALNVALTDYDRIKKGNIAGGSSVTLSIQANSSENYLGGCLRLARINRIILFDYWNSSVVVLGGDLPDTITITKSSNSVEITINNNTSSRVDYKLSY